MAPQSLFSLDSVDITDLLHGIPHPVGVLDEELRIVTMNRFLEAMTGYRTSEAEGVHSDYVFKSNFRHTNSPFSRVLETGEDITVDGDIITLQHKKIPIRFSISSLAGNTGSGILVVMEDITLLRETIKEHLPYVGGVEILGRSPQMLEIFELIPVLAQTDASVLITGETGTGKDKVAETIHKTSKRAHHPFIKINCGALPESLLESELFGHVRGAFTGATQDKPGMFRLAHGGTLFLTEIGDLPLPLQIKLLSVLDDHEFFPVGGSKRIKVDVRIIAATHRTLQDRVKQGSFREDLFYRLNVLRLHLPALRDREGDTRLLLDHFLTKFDTRLNKGNRGFTKEATETLNSYQYPGNVRELRNIVEYAANISHDSQITHHSLPKYLLKKQTPHHAEDSDTKDHFSATGSVYSFEVDMPQKERGWKELEKDMIIDALKKCGGNRSHASKLLGWGRTTLWRKLKQYNLS